MRQPQNADLSSFRLKRFGGKVENFCDEQNTKQLDVVISSADDHPWPAQSALIARQASRADAGPRNPG
jgi:phage-related protein